MADLDTLKRQENKIDELTATVNRLSQSFDAYAAQHPPAYNGNSAKNVDDPGYVEGETDFSKDENEDRGNWSGRLDFLLACLGYAVGLGNVWRFPYLCYKNGGAIFFIPYCIMLFLVGMPIFFLELSLGQFTSASPLTCWNMARFFKGIGVGMVIVSTLVGLYYNMIIAWAIWYLFATLINATDLPWQHCDGYWNTALCNARLAQGLNESTCVDLGLFANLSNGVCYNMSEPENSTEFIYGLYDKELAANNSIKPILASEEYLNGRVFGKTYSEGIGDLGPIRWELLLSLILAWIIVYLSLIKGVKSSGKVVYFTALFPYLVLVILLIRGVTLEGHFEGIEFYILKPDLSKLQDAAVWRDAAQQIFFSLSASWGGLIALASYNRFHNDCLRDSLIVSLGNCLTSFFAGFVIFSFLGFLAHELNTTVDDVAESGVGLAFIVYPDAVTRMPVSGLWAVLFFVMLITLGLDSEFALVETVSTSLMDQFVSLRERKALTLGVMSIIGLICGLPLCTNGGAFVLQLMDHYAGGWNVLVLALAECICVGYVYAFCGGPMIKGRNRWKEDIRTMIGTGGCWNWDCFYLWWALCWFFLTPACVLFILIFSWVDYSEVTYDDYVYPMWAAGIGWVLTLLVVSGMAGTSVILCIMQCMKGEPVADLFRPSRDWGPALVKHRKLVLRYVHEDNFVVDPWSDDLQMNDIKTDFDNPSFAGEKM